MNIIYVLNVTTLAAGATKSFLGLLNAARKKHNVLVIVPDNGEVVRYLKDQGVEVRVLPYIFNIRPFTDSVIDIALFIPRLIKRKLANRISARMLERISREFKADIIHTNTTVNEIGLLAAEKLHIPHIFHVREYGDKDHNLHIYGIYRQLHTPGSYNIFITKDIAAYHDCADRGNSIVVYNPVVDSSKVRPATVEKSYFLYAGRVERTKGILDLVEGYIKYVKDNPGDALPLKIAGAIEDTPYQREMKKKVDEMISGVGISDMVEWLGERKDIGDIMARARAVVVPSFFEGFGRIMTESMAAGTLVIGRDTGGTHEQFENGVAISGREIGLRFSDIPGLASALAQAADMPDAEYREIVNASQEVIKSLYSQEVSTISVLSFYEKVHARTF